MYKMIMLVGIPCSGKSTYLESMPNLADYKILSADNIIEKRAKELGKTYSEIFMDYHKTANCEFQKELVNAIKRGENIIVDRTNLSKKKRKEIISLTKGYEKTCVDFHISLEKSLQRNETRAKTGKYIPPAIIKEMFNNYEKPALNEGFHRIITIDANDNGKQAMVVESSLARKIATHER